MHTEEARIILAYFENLHNCLWDSWSNFSHAVEKSVLRELNPRDFLNNLIVENIRYSLLYKLHIIYTVNALNKLCEYW